MVLKHYNFFVFVLVCWLLCLYHYFYFTFLVASLSLFTISCYQILLYSLLQFRSSRIYSYKVFKVSYSFQSLAKFLKIQFSPPPPRLLSLGNNMEGIGILIKSGKSSSIPCMNIVGYMAYNDKDNCQNQVVASFFALPMI